MYREPTNQERNRIADELDQAQQNEQDLRSLEFLFRQLANVAKANRKRQLDAARKLIN